LVTAVDDALEGLVAPVVGDVLFEPRLGRRPLPEHLATLPETLELEKVL
jgi:hypothetical protein